MPAPLTIMFASLLGYGAVAWFLVRWPQTKRVSLLMTLLPLVPGLWSALWIAALLETQLRLAESRELVSGSCLLAAVTMIFCGALIAIFTTMLRRSREREEIMSAMAAKLRFEEAQSSLLVSSISGVLWQRCPVTWGYLRLSPQADGFLGFHESEWRQGAAFFLEHLHPKDVDRVQRAWKDSLAARKRYQIEFRFQKAHGDYAVLCEDGVPLPDANGQLAICGVLKDISLRHAEAESQRRQHKQQVDAAHEAGKAEIAKSVLHNIGNVLTSLNVSAKLHVDKLAASRGANLGRVARMIHENEDNLARFFKEHPQGRRLPPYLISLSDHLAQESRQLYLDGMSMVQHIEHMRDVIALQQLHGRASQMEEVVDLTSLMEQALALEGDALRDHELTVERHFADMPPQILPKNLLLQVLVNLISNARHAIGASATRDRRISLSISQPSAGTVCLSVQDTGCGISKPNLKRIFTYGFTTRQGGNGFGLHHAALLVDEIGGNLKAHSEGEGRGATFIIEFPTRFAPPALAAAARVPITSALPKSCPATPNAPPTHVLEHTRAHR